MRSEAAGAPGPCARAITALLSGLVDYAGLFPPAALPMEAVVRNYGAYARSEHAAVLGRLIVPVARLGELGAALGAEAIDRVRVSALSAGAIVQDVEAIRAFNEGPLGGLAVVDALEVKAASPGEVTAIAAACRDFETFVEVALGAELEVMLDAVTAHGLRAKVRTGGVTPDAIPEIGGVGRFIVGCAERRLAFKATAGLHHPIRASHPLTYEPDAPVGFMHGFLNVFIAAAFAWNGEPNDVVLAALDERAASAFVWDDAGVRWEGSTIPAGVIAEARAHFACSFGSCSFTEPIDDLKALLLL